MKKGFVLSTALAVAALAMVTGTELSAGPAKVSDSIVIGAMDWKVRGGSAPVVQGPWKKCGIVIKPDQPFEYENDHVLNFFPVKVPCEPGAPWFYFVFSRKDKTATNLVMMDRKGKHLLSRDGKGVFTMTGLPSDMVPGFPEVFKLGSNHYRMYFWAYGIGNDTKIRFMTAESKDLYRWHVMNNAKPLFCHHADYNWGDGLPPSRICNDATTVYRRPDGSWELYSAAITSITDPKSRYADKSVCPGFMRIVMRWTSPDGLQFSNPEIIQMPDSKDSPATQFYYLTAHDVEPYAVGILGNFNIRSQRLLLEPVWSRDRRHWVRPLRNNMLFEKDYINVAAITDMVSEPDGNVSLYYSASNTDHDGKILDGAKREENKLYKAQVHRRRFFGRRLQQGVTLVSPEIRFTGRNPRIYVSDGASLKAEWQDSFSTSRKSVKVEVKNGVAEVKLAGAVQTTATGSLFVSGIGIVYDAEY